VSRGGGREKDASMVGFWDATEEEGKMGLTDYGTSDDFRVVDGGGVG